MVRLLLLLLCLGLTLVCAHEEESNDVVRSNFDVSKLSGEWYTILLASNVKEGIEENGVMRGFMDYIQAWDNSSLSFKFHIKINGECIPFSLFCEKASVNGEYNVMYAGSNTFSIIEVVYDDYIIIHLINFNSEKTFEMMGLYARKPDGSPELKKNFKKICRKYGISEENVLDLTKVDRCLQVRENQVAQDSRLVTCDGERLAQGSLPFNKLGVYVQFFKYYK